MENEVIQLNADLRERVANQFEKHRAAYSALHESQSKINALIKKLDVNGELEAAIRESAPVVEVQRQEELAMNAILQEVQTTLNRDLSGFTLDPKAGTFTKPVPVADVPAPVEKPKKKAKRKSKR